jgi:hypothetical protein
VGGCGLSKRIDGQRKHHPARSALRNKATHVMDLKFSILPAKEICVRKITLTLRAGRFLNNVIFYIMSKFLCIREASDFFGVSTQTLRRWERQGKLTQLSRL